MDEDLVKETNEEVASENEDDTYTKDKLHEDAIIWIKQHEAVKAYNKRLRQFKSDHKNTEQRIRRGLEMLHMPNEFVTSNNKRLCVEKKIKKQKATVKWLMEFIQDHDEKKKTDLMENLKDAVARFPTKEEEKIVIKK